MCPTPLVLSPSRVRIYLTCRDEKGRGRIGYVDVSAEEPKRILEVGREPLLDIGRPGAFDDNGVVASSAVATDNGRILLYYVGYELGVHIRYRALTGLAFSDDGTHFERFQETPILERSPTELYFRASPYVRKENDHYQIWYTAGSEWTNLREKLMPVYDLRYAESKDGIHWPAQGKVALRISGTDEHGFSRPWVRRTNTGWELFYSVRRKSFGAYRMGYATSPDGETWERNDSSLGLDVSGDGWDSNGISYAAPVVAGGRMWLFYNGNNFGETGFGVAVRED